MKRTTSIFTFFLCCIFINISCSDDLNEDYNERHFESEIDYKNASRGHLSDCIYPFGDYGDAQYLHHISGKVVEKYDMLLIKYYDQNSLSVRLLDPCNLPRNYIQGQNVRFSGIEKIPPPYVRLYAPIIRLTKIKKK